VRRERDEPRADRDAWIARDPLPPDPMPILAGWLAEALEARRQPHPDAVALATVDPGGLPSVRMVLCRGLDPAAGTVTFYSNRHSRKARALLAHPFAALAFHFAPEERQARLEGPVVLADDATSDAYFASRPLDAQVSAWASAQSEPIASRAELDARVASAARRLGVVEGRQPPGGLPRPAHWGGFVLVAHAVELWVGRLGRVHDRALWTREPAGGQPDPWRVVRLQP
jgi:pyridoxamine 5'-phosphate oxidase